MHDVFSYETFKLDESRREVTFRYRLQRNNQTHDFCETLRFPLSLLNNPATNRALRALHIALGISYYKIFVPALIVSPYAMDSTEASFWNDIWQHGLGEFLYVNKLTADKLARFEAQSGLELAVPETTNTAVGALLGLGGGKDSIVAGELLKQLKIPTDTFVMATGAQLGQTQDVARTMGLPLHVVERTLDTTLLDLQEQPGAYKGHVPISLVFALVGTTLALALNKQYVVVANESSASSPRIEWNGTAVNHQWSKSFGFEVQLQNFVQGQISPDITYFSAIRQLSSVAVAKVFSSYPQYFEVFTSDNYVFRIDPTKRPNSRWGLESAKSLSSFILLAPWLNTEDMLRTFGIDFLDQPELKPLFKRSIGLEGEPPLDCVGTVEELVLCLQLAHAQGKYLDSSLMKLAIANNMVPGTDSSTTLTSLLTLADEQALPIELGTAILDNMRAKVQA